MSNTADRPGGDTPLGGLPSAEPVLLASHDLELVIVEVRYTGATGVLSADDALRLRDELAEVGVFLPSIETVANQQVSFEVGPQGPNANVSTRELGWQLASADGRMTAVVTTDVVRVQTAQYVRWSESLGTPLTSILRAAQPALQPQLVQRIGVRFINRFADPEATSPRAWIGRIETPFLGPITHAVLGERLRGTQQQVDLELGPAQGALIRHGAFADAAERGATSYLLDIDVYNQTGLPTDPDTVVDVATRLDRTALVLFQQVTTPALREQMRPYPRPEPAAASPQETTKA